eukprot:660806-Pleurochrysis_carterae.AAC.1
MASRSVHFFCRFAVVCRVAPLKGTNALQARPLAIDAHSTVSVASVASQVQSHLARTSPLTLFGSVAASFHRSGSTMTAQLNSSWPLVLDSLVGAVVKHRLSVVTEAVAVHIYTLLPSQQLDRVDARASGLATMPAVYIALTSVPYSVSSQVSTSSKHRRVVDIGK